ncbi:hypothetical protein [Rathayibacter rathayi]|uniref:hypothetical protein n=1 Tax=Rathayibacter rathayi TaxID=33887 RepID=UPI0021578D93|nr:hypothetical protein [Rathayibacter rathayi]
MQRFRTAESAVLPWIVLSQTVALIASYLAFFPVSIRALRGLGSPTAHQVELMHVYGVGWWQNDRRRSRSACAAGSAAGATIGLPLEVHGVAAAARRSSRLFSRRPSRSARSSQDGRSERRST